MSAKKVWAEVPVRFNLDWTLSGQGAQDAQPVTGWRLCLVTSGRVVGRLADDRLHGYRWDRSNRRPGGSLTWTRSGKYRHRRRANVDLVRPRRNPDGGGHGIPALRPTGHDRAPRPRHVPGLPGSSRAQPGPVGPSARGQTGDWAHRLSRTQDVPYPSIRLFGVFVLPDSHYSPTGFV